MRVSVLLSVVCFVYGQNDFTNKKIPTDLHNDFSQRVGNFSLELLYHTSNQEKANNMIMSPITVWTLMSVIAEGASDDTLSQINFALRTFNNKTETRLAFQTIAQWLQVQTNTVELAKLNAIFVDSEKLPNKDFVNVAKTYYDTQLVPLNFSKDSTSLAEKINQGISRFTHGKIDKLVEESFFSEAQMLLTSALYFKGQWTVPFNSSLTTVKPFFDSNGKKIGQVNMMYNRHNYPFANIKSMQARVIELPYGRENRLSMLIILPYPDVSLVDMFKNFLKIPLDTMFLEMQMAKEIYNDDEVDCFLPRFKIESNLDLTNIMKESFGIADLFDENNARLPLLARTPLYVTKVIHKAKIEVTEEGTEAAAVSAAEITNRIGATRFDANRPFCYVIVEKVTNTIVFGGFYENPSLY